eukprot:TRINITY_DN1746_c0_g1_i1.p1 TRINITY_DN1746_c0_g1~~TRINITY_DN1746_c0_g1_i1.p1  ORF type:complete len:562 (+),score=105.67 TRINITY_DN1746_c0_g1_i1:126-1811(+)
MRSKNSNDNKMPVGDDTPTCIVDSKPHKCVITAEERLRTDNQLLCAFDLNTGCYMPVVRDRSIPLQPGGNYSLRLPSAYATATTSSRRKPAAPRAPRAATGADGSAGDQPRGRRRSRSMTDEQEAVFLHCATETQLPEAQWGQVREDLSRLWPHVGPVVRGGKRVQPREQLVMVNSDGSHTTVNDGEQPLKKQRLSHNRSSLVPPALLNPVVRCEGSNSQSDDDADDEGEAEEEEAAVPAPSQPQPPNRAVRRTYEALLLNSPAFASLLREEEAAEEARRAAAGITKAEESEAGYPILDVPVISESEEEDDRPTAVVLGGDGFLPNLSEESSSDDGDENRPSQAVLDAVRAAFRSGDHPESENSDTEDGDNVDDNAAKTTAALPDISDVSSEEEDDEHVPAPATAVGGTTATAATAKSHYDAMLEDSSEEEEDVQPPVVQQQPPPVAALPEISDSSEDEDDAEADVPHLASHTAPPLPEISDASEDEDDEAGEADVRPPESQQEELPEISDSSEDEDEAEEAPLASHTAPPLPEIRPPESQQEAPVPEISDSSRRQRGRRR